LAIFLQYLFFFFQNFVCSFGQQLSNDFVHNGFSHANNSDDSFASASASGSKGSRGGDSSVAVENVNYFEVAKVNIKSKNR
jgi:hypothetical protein